MNESKSRIGFAYALLVTLALSGIFVAVEAAALVHRAEATADKAPGSGTLRTHGQAPHLHANLQTWQTLARMRIEDIFPGEVWSVIAQAAPKNYPGEMAFLLRVLVCQAECVHTIGVPPSGPWIFSLAGQYMAAATAPSGNRHDLITRADHWVVPDSISGDYNVELQILFYNVPYGAGHPQGTPVYFVPGSQVLSIMRQ